MQKLVATKMLKRAVLFALLIGLSMVTVVSAITIVVDGDRESVWITGAGGQTPGVNAPADPNEAGIDDNVDIEWFRWTNDTTNFYFSIETYDPPTVEGPVDICLDTDKNVATDIPVANGVQRNRCSYGTGVTGIDTVVRVTADGSGGVDLVRVFNVSVWPPTNLGAGTAGHVNPNFFPLPPNPVLEIAVPLNLLGFNNATCTTGIPAVVYYDGGDTNPDDNLPDSGTVLVSCGAPTAVTLANANAQSQTGYFIVLALVGVFGLGLLSFATVQKRR
ncbi:MAG: hypothetical protein OT477_15560 [Chloroflexi bacterium]|nr:hypothetical protein [Chloroflexota bacterium]